MGNEVSIIEFKTRFLEVINYCYLIYDNKSKECILIDPSWDFDIINSTIRENQLDMKAIFLTHSHYDHVNLVDDLTNKYNNDVYMSEKEAISYEFNSKNLKLLNDKQIINIGNIKIESILTPGHTSGGMCYLVNNNYIFTGDTIFIEGCGICDQKGSSPEEMYDSLAKIKDYVDGTVLVYPGHSFGSPRGASLEHLYNNNLYFQFKDKSTFTRFRMRRNQRDALSSFK